MNETELEVEKEVREAVQEFLRQENEPLTIVPSKPNWDLKRDLNKKLKGLGKKTERALVELLKESLRG